MGEPRVLVVEDEADVRKHLVRALRREGMTVDEARDGEEAKRLFEESLPPIVLLDLQLPKMYGMKVLEIIHQRRPETQVVILSGHGTMKDAIEAVNLHAAAYLEKPPDIDAIVAAIRAAWSTYQECVGMAITAPEETPPDLQSVRDVLGNVPLEQFESKDEP